MAYGHRDFGQAGTDGIVAPVTDIGELAVRTGGLFAFDRAGNVIWETGFEHGMEGFLTDGFVAPAFAGVRTDKAYQGAGYMHILTAANLNAQLAAYRDLPPIQTGRIGLSCVITFFNLTPEAQMHLLLTNGVGTYQFVLYASTSGREFGYYNSGLSRVPLLTIPNALQNSGIYLHLKMVVDTSTMKWVRAKLNGSSFSLAGISPATGAASPATTNTVYLYSLARSAAQAGVGFDNVIFTANEP